MTEIGFRHLELRDTRLDELDAAGRPIADAYREYRVHVPAEVWDPYVRESPTSEAGWTGRS